MINPESITIVLPLPPRRLSPNRPALTPGGRMAVASATKRYRQLARQAAEAGQLETTPWQSAVARLRFYWPDRRRRDTRNAEATMKAAYDGLVDAGVLADDDAATLAHQPTEFFVDAACPRVELTIARN